MKGNNESKTRSQFLNGSKSKQTPAPPPPKKNLREIEKKNKKKYSKRWKILKETKELDM
jgi:hypothetical protein